MGLRIPFQLLPSPKSSQKILLTKSLPSFCAICRWKKKTKKLVQSGCQHFFRQLFKLQWGLFTRGQICPHVIKKLHSFKPHSEKDAKKIVFRNQVRIWEHKRACCLFNLLFWEIKRVKWIPEIPKFDKQDWG